MNKSEKKVKKKIGVYGWLSRIAAIVTFAVIVSCTLVSSLFARYLGTGEQASGARVARYYVSAAMTSGQDTTLDLNNNNRPVDFSITIVNFNGNTVSEVGVEYSIIITCDNYIEELGFTLRDDSGKEISAEKETSEDGKIVTFKKAGEFAAAVKATHVRKIRIDFAIERDTLGVVNIGVTVVASQKVQ